MELGGTIGTIGTNRWRECFLYLFRKRGGPIHLSHVSLSTLVAIKTLHCLQRREAILICGIQKQGYKKVVCVYIYITVLLVIFFYKENKKKHGHNKIRRNARVQRAKRT